LVKPDKSRYVWLYLPSKADKERWQGLADEARTPLSKFCISIIEERLSEDEEFKPRREMVKALEELKAENKGLRDDLHLKNIVLERYEAELRRYRGEIFQSPGFEGTRRYSKELVDLLKSKGHVDSYGLLEALGVDPREAEQVRTVSRQLEELEEYGMIRPEGRGWRWIS